MLPVPIIELKPFKKGVFKKVEFPKCTILHGSSKTFNTEGLSISLCNDCLVPVNKDYYMPAWGLILMGKTNLFNIIAENFRDDHKKSFYEDALEKIMKKCNNLFKSGFNGKYKFIGDTKTFELYTVMQKLLLHIPLTVNENKLLVSFGVQSIDDVIHGFTNLLIEVSTYNSKSFNSVKIGDFKFITSDTPLLSMFGTQELSRGFGYKLFFVRDVDNYSFTNALFYPLATKKAQKLPIKEVSITELPEKLVTFGQVIHPGDKTVKVGVILPFNWLEDGKSISEYNHLFGGLYKAVPVLNAFNDSKYFELVYITVKFSDFRSISQEKMKVRVNKDYTIFNPQKFNAVYYYMIQFKKLKSITK